MEFLILLFITICVLFFFFLKNKSTVHRDVVQRHTVNIDPEKKSYKYKTAGQLLTPAEVSFKHVLKIAIEAKYDINAKVRLADIIEVEKGYSRSEWQKAFNKINKKHIDFVLTDRKTSEIICCIELDDSSHNRRDRQERDSFVDEALESANIKIIHIKAAESYSSDEIKQALGLIPLEENKLVIDSFPRPNGVGLSGIESE